MPTIQNAESVPILVTRQQHSNGPIIIRNEAIGTGIAAGVDTGVVAGGLWGRVCGPFAPLCMPLGAVTGTAARTAVGVTGALSDEKAARLRARMLRIQAAHPLDDGLERRDNDRAVKAG